MTVVLSHLAPDGVLVSPSWDEARVAAHGAGTPLGTETIALGAAHRRTLARDVCAATDLPPFLARNAGLNSGLMMAHVTAAALVSENKVLAHPASVDTIPTSAGKEDHVSMGVHAARKALEIVENTATVLGIELLAAAQALDFHDKRPGRGALAGHRFFRRRVLRLERDRVLAPDIEAARTLVLDSSFRVSVEKAAGPLS